MPYLASVERVDVPRISPHRAVKYTFRRSRTPCMVRRLAQPRTFGREKPIGCPRAPFLVPPHLLTPPPHHRRRRNDDDAGGTLRPGNHTEGIPGRGRLHGDGAVRCYRQDAS